MRGPADFIIPIVWKLIPFRKRERLSSLILSLQSRTTINVPASDVVVFTKQERERARTEDVPLPVPKQQFRYSLLSTCYNEAATIEAWLDSVASQTLPATQVVLVDGGSSDATVKRVEDWRKRTELEKGRLPFDFKLVTEGRKNIAQGRNLAAELASEDILAFTDVGCEIDRFWAERLLEPFGSDSELQFSMGWYRSVVQSEFDRAVERYLVPRREAIDPATYLPSGRSLAIRKDLFRSVRGFPEYLTFAGEDSLFDYFVKCRTDRAAFVPDALAYWKCPSGPLRLFKAVSRYSRGDAEGAKLFALYYLNLLREYGHAAVELVAALVMFTLDSALKIPVCYWIGWAFVLFAAIRVYSVALKYRPFDRGGLFTKEGARSFGAVCLLTSAQALGYVRGLLSREDVEKRRRLCCPGGHAVVIAPQAPARGERSRLVESIDALIADGKFVTLVVSSFPKGQPVMFEHQFLDVFVRSHFDAERWLEKEMRYATAKRSVHDTVDDALSKTIVARLCEAGYQTPSV